MKHDLLITMNKDRSVPLNRQIYEHIRMAVHTGTLSSGDPLPPTRRLAEQLNVSRSVVLQSYELLQAEGYLEMRKGAGTFVASLTMGKPAEAESQSDRNSEQDNKNHFLRQAPDFSSLILPAPATSGSVNANSVFCDFRHGVPAWDAFPMDRWQKAVMNACRRATPDILGYGPAEGSLALRQEIARLLRSTRSIPVVPEQIVITTGATQALDILSRLCLAEGERVIVEDPSHHVVRETFKYSGGTVVPVPVDDEGICVDEIGPSLARLESNGQKAPVKLAYVTPSHQFPLGVTMSLNRRIRLLEWARSNNAFIIEDDYDSEYRYVGQKVSALAGLDSSGRVIYVGSFSKILFPALRIGYVVLPLSMLHEFLAVKWISDRMSPSLDQQALADFMQSGQYARHVTQMGKLYAARRACLVESLNREFGDRVRYYGEEAGLHLLIELESAADEASIAEAALQCGVRIYPASAYFTGGKPRGPVFLLGYSNLGESQIATGIQRVARAEAEVSQREQLMY